MSAFEPPKMSAVRILGIAVRSLSLTALVVASGYILVGSAFGLPIPLMGV